MQASWFTRCSLGCLSWSELLAERYPKSTHSYVQKLVPVRCLNRTFKNHLRWIKFGGRSDRVRPIRRRIFVQKLITLYIKTTTTPLCTTVVQSPRFLLSLLVCNVDRTVLPASIGSHQADSLRRILTGEQMIIIVS